MVDVYQIQTPEIDDSGLPSQTGILPIQAPFLHSTSGVPFMVYPGLQ